MNQAELKRSIELNRKELQKDRRDRRKLKKLRGAGKASLDRLASATAVVKKVAARLALRRKRYAALQGSNIDRAIRAALTKVGIREQGYNRGPFISDIIIAGGGQPGWPYCAYGVEWFLKQAGAPQYSGGLADMFRIWGNNGTNGFRRVNASDRIPGDVVMFDWNGNGSADHVGVYIGNGKTWEANTSPGSGGSQNDGGGIWIRERGLGNVCAVVRPPYRNWS